VGAFVAPLINELRKGPGGSALTAVSDAVVIKALLAHGARWGDLGSALLRHFESIENADKRTEQITRLLGFGRLEIDGIVECSPTRVTGIGASRMPRSPT
jgi:hypothetical protein